MGVTFEFRDSSSGSAVTLPSFYFTFFDFDHQQNGERRESLVISGWADAETCCDAPDVS